jgi:hypothetical protein
MSNPDETIFALSSAPGRAAIAVIRVSGPAVPEAVRQLAGRLPTPRRSALMNLRDPATATLYLSRISSASISALGMTGIREFTAACTSGLLAAMADEVTTTSAPPIQAASWPI